MDGQVTEEVQLRVMRELFSDDIPAPRDVAIISLASACGVFESILSQEELVEARERISLIRRMDLIGREVAAAVQQVESLPRLRRPFVRHRDSPGGRVNRCWATYLAWRGICAVFCSGNTRGMGRYSGYGFESPLYRPGGSRSECVRGADFRNAFALLGAVSRIRRRVGRASRHAEYGRRGASAYAPHTGQGLFAQVAGVQSEPCPRYYAARD